MILRDLGFDSDEVVAGLTCDSRVVKPGFVFAALPGTVTDGRKYIESALEKGASAILSTKGLELPVPYIGSDEPRWRMQANRQRVSEHSACKRQKVIVR